MKTKNSGLLLVALVIALSFSIAGQVHAGESPVPFFYSVFCSCLRMLYMG
jgi:hypothetical protein